MTSRSSSDPSASQGTKFIAASGFAASKGALPPTIAVVLFVVVWDLAIRLSGSRLFPSPAEAGAGILELVRQGVLLKHILASLFRITWGFSFAVLIGVPAGLWLGWNSLARRALNPLIQMLRPISPIAWIPLAILWFGVSDAAPIFIIFLASLFPIIVSTMAAVRNVSPVFIRVGRNFGLSGRRLLVKVIFPAALPQIITGLRIALGIAWMVVVAAEMIAVNSGLGYLIIDARNAGKRYDLVVAAMIIIGMIGWLLDWLMRRIERHPALAWSAGVPHE